MKQSCVTRKKEGWILLAFTILLSILAEAQTLTPKAIEDALNEAYNKFRDLKEGKNADYIKELANVTPTFSASSSLLLMGKYMPKGDITSMVSIQSVSKVFTMAKVIEEQGAQAVQDSRVDATGMRFNSIVAVELQKGKEINPLVNPGAIAASGLISGADSAAKVAEYSTGAQRFRGTAPYGKRTCVYQ